MEGCTVFVVERSQTTGRLHGFGVALPARIAPALAGHPRRLPQEPESCQCDAPAEQGDQSAPARREPVGSFFVARFPAQRLRASPSERVTQARPLGPALPSGPGGIECLLGSSWCALPSAPEPVSSRGARGWALRGRLRGAILASARSQAPRLRPRLAQPLRGWGCCCL